MLNGHLFGATRADQPQLEQNPHHRPNQQQERMAGMRYVIYASALVAAGLLVAQLAAQLYNRAQARRLLGSIPVRAPPALLVAGGLQPERPAHCPTEERRSAHLSVPVHLLVQLLALQLLLVLLVESQNYFSWRPLPAPSTDQSGSFEPIGASTWLAVVALYYLIASITCWLAVRLAELNLSLSPLCPVVCQRMLGSRGEPTDAHSPASSSSLSRAMLAEGSSEAPSLDDKSQAQYSSSATGNAISTSSIYAANANQQRAHEAPPGRLQASISPGSSFSSSTGDHNLHRHLHHLALANHGARLARPELEPVSLGLLAARLARLALTHLLPVVLAALVGWLTAGRAAKLNALLYTSQGGPMSQLAYWPLLVDASWPYLAGLIYYGPSVSVSRPPRALQREQPL